MKQTLDIPVDLGELVKRNPGNKAIEFNLTLLVTEDCNLDCRYCFEKKKRPQRMSFETAKAVLDKYLMSYEGPEAVNIDFCGGEPLLEFNLMRNIFNYCAGNGPWKKKFRFSIGTNGTIMTDEMKTWFVKHPCFQISLSLDGTKEVHDYNRSNSYDTIIKNIDFFKRYNQTVKMTISKFTIPRLADCIIHIHELGLKPEANVVFEDIWGTPQQKAELLQIYAKELDKLVDYYMANPDFTVPKLLSHRIETLMSNQEYGLEEKYCGAGRYMTAVMPDGEEYPCHRFSPLGSSVPAKNIDVTCPIIGPDKCINCGIRRLCHSCLGANLELAGSVDVRTSAHCEFVKLEVLASAKLAARRIELYEKKFSTRYNSINNENIEKYLKMKNFTKAIIWVQDNIKL